VPVRVPFDEWFDRPNRTNIYRVLFEPSYRLTGWASKDGHIELVVNGGAELGLSGWTEISGNWEAHDQAESLQSGMFASAYEGTHFFYPTLPGASSGSEFHELRQDIDVSAYAGRIADGLEFVFTHRSFYAGTSADGGFYDDLRVILEYRDDSGVLASYDTGWLTIAPGTGNSGWELLGDTRNAPTGTTTIRIRLQSQFHGGDGQLSLDAFHDAISLQIDAQGIYCTQFPDFDETWLPTKLKEDEIFLELVSIAEIISTHGSWCYDPATKEIVLHCSDGADPSTHFMQVFFLVSIASGKNPNKNTLVVDGLYYPPLLSDQGLSMGRMALDSIFYGTGIVNESKLIMDNSSGYFDAPIAKYTWEQRNVWVFLGDGNYEVDPAEEKTILSGIILNKEINFKNCTVNVESAITAFKFKVPNKRFNLEDYPDMDPTLEGKTIPWLLGPWTGVPCYKIANDRWKININGLDYLSQVRADEDSISFEADLALGEFNAAVPEGATPVADCGRGVDIDGNPGADEQHIAELLKFLLKDQLRMTDLQLDTAAFAALSAAHTRPVHIYAGVDPKAAEELIESAEKTMFGYVKVTDEGLIMPALFDPNAETKLDLQPIDIYDIAQRTEPGRIYDGVDVGYAFDPLTGQYQYVHVAHPEAKKEFANTDFFQIDTLFINENDAKYIGKLWMLIGGKYENTIEVESTHKGYNATLGEIVAVTFPRGFTKSGEYDRDRFMVREWARKHVDSQRNGVPTAVLLLQDFFGIDLSDLTGDDIFVPPATEGVFPASWKVFSKSSSPSAVGVIREIYSDGFENNGEAIEIAVCFNRGVTSCLPDIVRWNGVDCPLIKSSSAVDSVNSRTAVYALFGADTGKHKAYVHFPVVVDNVSIRVMSIKNATDIRDSEAAYKSASGSDPLTISASVTSEEGDFITASYTKDKGEPTTYHHVAEGQIRNMGTRLQFNGSYTVADAMNAEGSHRAALAGSTTMTHSEERDVSRKTLVVVCYKA